ncbi:MAG: (d)CMP kinase [Desulfotalea sp.]
MCSKINVVCIDGPAGVGKSTISRKVASILGYTYLDTGAMYRAIGIFLKNNGIDLTNENDVACAITDVELKLISNKDGDTGVIIAGEDVSEEIRLPSTSLLASEVSALACVREKLTELQRNIGAAGYLVAEGRDMGTVVFPLARHKFFLEASAEIRTTRRIKQLEEKGDTSITYDVLLEQIITRDKNDRTRKIAPLKQADDAHLVDTGILSIGQVVKVLLEKIDQDKA